MHVLIVEDDHRLAGYLRKGLEEMDHRVAVAVNGGDGLGFAASGDFDVLIVDVMLPVLDGLSMVRRLRSSGNRTPILLLTARDADEDVVTGLDAGADDYLIKPFSFRVLCARLRALSRRKEVAPGSQLRVADLLLDPERHELRRSDDILALTRTEFQIMHCLMRNAGRVVTRSRLIEEVWGCDRDVQNNTLDVFIRQLRSKVDARDPRLIHTVRGVGFALRHEDA